MRQTLPKIERCRRPRYETASRGIEYMDLGAKPEYVKFLIKAGLDRISVAPLMMKMEIMSSYPSAYLLHQYAKPALRLFDSASSNKRHDIICITCQARLFWHVGSKQTMIRSVPEVQSLIEQGAVFQIIIIDGTTMHI